VSKCGVEGVKLCTTVRKKKDDFERNSANAGEGEGTVGGGEGGVLLRGKKGYPVQERMTVKRIDSAQCQRGGGGDEVAFPGGTRGRAGATSDAY